MPLKRQAGSGELAEVAASRCGTAQMIMVLIGNARVRNVGYSHFALRSL